MNFTIIFCLVLYGLTFLCFFIPFNNGQKLTGTITGIILGVVVTSTLAGTLDLAVIFIWPLILIFQIIFLTYWIFRVFQRRKTGQLIATVLTVPVLLLVMQPWISDWTFNKRDVRKILASHNLALRDEFKILENESFGFRDYYETFTVKLSDNDFNRIAQTIKTSKNYKGFFTGYSNIPSADHKTFDTIDLKLKSTL
jgi:hypothetical protein